MSSTTIERMVRWIGVWVLLLLAGCQRAPGLFVIIQNQVPQAGCVIPADLGNLYRGRGVLDVSLVTDSTPDGYIVFPLLENDLPAPAGGQLVDANRIALTGFNIDVRANIETPDATRQVLERPDNAGFVHFASLTSGSVASGGGHTASAVNAILPQLARAFGSSGDLANGKTAAIEVHLSARGNRVAGSIDSDVFTYPITLCSGCLIASSPACPVSNTPPLQGNSCNVAQDEPVDCCNLGGRQICPAAVASQ
jgi:hypothetical protein